MNEDIRQIIKETVEDAVDKKINGKLLGITNHLKEQDAKHIQVKELLEDQKFWSRLWKLIKQVFYGAVSLGTAYILYKKINK